MDMYQCQMIEAGLNQSFGVFTCKEDQIIKVSHITSHNTVTHTLGPSSIDTHIPFLVIAIVTLR